MGIRLWVLRGTIIIHTAIRGSLINNVWFSYHCLPSTSPQMWVFGAALSGSGGRAGGCPEKRMND